jgi:hypothetical protein
MASTSTSLPKYDDHWLDRHWPKHPFVYHHQPLPWRGSLLRDDASNSVLQNQANVYLALTECPELAGLVWYESREKRFYIIGKLPDDDMFAPDQCRPLSRDDVTAILIFLQLNDLPAINRGMVYWGIRHIAMRYHPFRFQVDFDVEGEA